MRLIKSYFDTFIYYKYCTAKKNTFHFANVRGAYTDIFLITLNYNAWCPPKLQKIVFQQIVSPFISQFLFKGLLSHHSIARLICCFWAILLGIFVIRLIVKQFLTNIWLFCLILTAVEVN